MTTESIKAIVRRFFQTFEANDLEVLKDVLAPDLVAYNLNAQIKTLSVKWYAMN